MNSIPKYPVFVLVLHRLLDKIATPQAKGMYDPRDVDWKLTY
jgi:hypothetical protein